MTTKFPHARTSADVLLETASGPHGLSSSEALVRLANDGPNALPKKAPPSIVRAFAGQFRSPLIYILIAAAIVAFALRYWADGAFIVVVLLLNAVIGTVQEHAAERSAEALGKLVPERTMVLRGGDRNDIAAESLVVGDVVLLEAGSKVPADLRLVSATALAVDESLLTGESATVAKDASVVLPDECPVAERSNLAFAATMVVRGKAHGVVFATASRTQIGVLATSLQRTMETKPPLLQRMDRFSTRVAWAVGAAVVLVGGVASVRGMSLATVFLLCVALAVSAIPEGLPVALTVALAIATRRMSKRNVIVRKLVAVEALGSCTYVASDKTGTLTMNELTVTRIAFPREPAWTVHGAGTHAGRVEPTGELAPGVAAGMIARLAATGVFCNDGTLTLRDGVWASHGDAVDVALLSLGHKVGLSAEELVGERPCVASLPFEAENRFAASVHREGETFVVHVKGALEKLLPMCMSMVSGDGDVPLDEAAIQLEASRLAEDGYRVLALVAGPVPHGALDAFSVGALRELTFLGLVAMIDPLRPEAKAAVAACRRAGVEVAMVTGDHPVTAFAIARQLDMAERADQVVTGAELDAAEAAGLSAFDALVARARVFARMEPRQKLGIVQALTRLGHFVAVTGDGANDAPALRAAHVGVAMAKRGTDVAREASSLIVTDDDFASIVAGIEEGRVAYANVRKVVFLLISTGATEVVLFFLCIGIGLPPPLLPAQLLWLNLVTNGIQDVALAFEPAEGGELLQKPRSPQEPIFNRVMLERVALTAIVMGGGGTWLFRNLVNDGVALESARNTLLLALVLFENFQVGASRSEKRSMFVVDPRKNPLLVGGTLVAFGIHVLAMMVPAMKSVLSTSMVPLATWPMLFLIAIAGPLVLEAHKVVRRTVGH